ncbi:hypothetical protein TWF718_008793 [Orbilia javanica]|uniref:C2H2-type domain-containing protein n=1 Tax=Orbilia javanica TaxID=47235 RepID=A0AAN8MQW5_9PEZI
MPSGTQPIHAATAACRKSFSTCLTVPRLKEGGWAENRLVDFNLWAAGAGVSAKGKLSLDQRLSPNPEVQRTIVNLLELLQMFVEDCRDLANDTSSASNDPGATEQEKGPEDNEGLSTEEVDQASIVELSHAEIEARRDVEVTLDQIIRLTVAIRKAGSNSRLKRADKSFNLENPQIQELKAFLELIVHPRGFKEPGKLTPIQSRLVEANLRRWHRFSYAKLHSRKLARSDTAPMETIPEKPALAPENPLQVDSKPVVSFSIPETGDASRVSIVTPQDEPHRALSAIAPTATTAASAIEGNILVPEKQIIRTPATVLSKVSSKITYPRPPSVSQYNTVFKCPCCLQSLPVAYTERSQWKKHLASDILPYTCVFPDCQQPLQLYLTRKDWEQHIKTEHGQLWVCAVCEQLGVTTEFSNEDDLVGHLRTIHGDSVENDEIPMFVTASSSLKPIDVVDCPLCIGPNEDEDSLEHIAHCIHDFSLNSLPLPSDSDGEGDYFDIDSRNSDSQNTPSSFSADERDSEGLAELDDDDSSVGDQHKISESSLKTLARDLSGPTGISVLDWKLEEATEIPQPEIFAGENAEEDAEETAEETVEETAEEPVADPDVAKFYSPHQRALYRIAWLCLTEIDALVAEILLDRVDLVPETSQSSGSMFEYRLGQVGPHLVVVAWPPKSVRYRGPDWCLATELNRSFRSLNVFLHVGTAPGLASETRLSDVVVSGGDGIHHYTKKSIGGQYTAVEHENRFELTATPIADCLERAGEGVMPRPPRNEAFRRLMDFGYLQRSYTDLRDVHFGPEVVHGKGGPLGANEVETCQNCYQSPVTRPPSSRIVRKSTVHHGGIVCGSSLTSDIDTEKLLSTASLNTGRKIRCLDTEGSLLAYAKVNNLIVIRGISSYMDTHQDIRWKKVAACAAATYAKKCIQIIDLDLFLVFPPLSGGGSADDFDEDLGGLFDDPMDAASQAGSASKPVPSIALVSPTDSVAPSSIHSLPLAESEDGDGLKTRCLFYRISCPYTTSDPDAWVRHIKEHLIIPGKESPDLGMSVFNHPQPLSWLCGFEDCLVSQTLPDEEEMTELESARYDRRTVEKTPLDAYQLQNSLETEVVLDSKLKHIHKHLVDNRSLEEYREERDWEDFFQSVPVKLLESEMKLEGSQNMKELEFGTPEEIYLDDMSLVDEEILEPQEIPEQVAQHLTPFDIDFGFTHSRYLSNRSPSTSSWFTRLPQFREWVETPSKILLFKGLPGAGKSTIMATIYNHLREIYREDAIVILIYCEEDSPRQWTTRKAVQYIQRQLDPYTEDIGYQPKSENSPEFDPDWVSGALECFTSKYPNKRVFILLDNLEDLQEVGFHNPNVSWRRCSVNTMYSTRQGVIRAVDINADYTIDVAGTHSYFKDDVQSYLRRSLLLSPGIFYQDVDDEERLKYVDTIAERVNGVFAIAVPIVNEILRIKPIAMEELSKPLEIGLYDSFYDNFKHRITTSSRSPGRQNMALLSAALMGHPDRIPGVFSVSELREALAYHSQRPPGRFEQSSWPSLDFLSIYSDGLIYCNDVKNIVEFFHPTVEEYFKRKAWEWYPDGIDAALSVVTQYLSSDLFADGPCPHKALYMSRLGQNPYFRRASMEWGCIARRCEDSGISPEILRIILEFLMDDSLVASVAQVIEIERPDSGYYGPLMPFKGIHLAASVGLCSLTGELAKFQDIDARDFNNDTPLARAIDGGFVETVRILKHLGASSINIKNGMSTALLEAIPRGSLEIVQMLLRYEDDPDTWGTVDEIGRAFTPLNLAITYEQHDILKELIDLGGADIENGVPRPPLITAIMQDDLESVRILMDRGSESGNLANEIKFGDETPLFYAANQGCEEIVKLLVESGADVNVPSANPPVTPLKAAMNFYMRTGLERGKRIMEFLREHGGVENALNYNDLRSID